MYKRLIKLGLLLVLVGVVAAGCSGCGKNGKGWWFGKDKNNGEVTEVEPATIYTEPINPEEPSIDTIPLAPTIESPAKESPDLEMVRFAFDRYNLSPATKDVLNRNYQWLDSNPDVQVQIQGHCDERGTIEYNFNLGQKRADSVREYLISLGVDPSRLHTISYGEERPIDPAQNEEAYGQNRRAQFLVY